MKESHHIDPPGTALREVINMSWPIIMGSLSFTVMQFVDQMMVARLGTAEFAAVGPSGLWTYTFATFLLGMVSCVTTFVAQSIGRGEPENCGRYAWQGIYLSLASGLVAMACWPLAGPFFRSMGHSAEVTEMEIIYFRYRMLGFIFMTWQGALAGFFQAIARPHIPMWAGVIANVVNIGLDYVLIFGKFGFPEMGIAGAAIATVISQVVQALYLQMAFYAKSVDSQYNTRNGYALDLVRMGELFRIGWPAGLTWFMDIFNWGIFTSYIVGRIGDGQTPLAAHNVAITFMQLSFMPVVGIHHAVAPLVGQYVGRQDIPRAKDRAYIALRLGMVYMFSIGIVMALAGRPLITLFFGEDHSVDVVRLGHQLLMLAALFQAFDAVNIVMSGALRGAGDTRWMALVSFIGGYCGFLPMAYLFAFGFGWGALGAWIGATIYVIGLSGVLFGRFHGERWRHVRIFAHDRAAPDVP